MISEFVYLKPVRNSEYKASYLCCLPDPDIYGEFRMIPCGHVELEEEPSSGDCFVKVELSDNLEALCVGDPYHRESFVTAILDILKRDTDFLLDNAWIILKDPQGDFAGYAHEINEGERS